MANDKVCGPAETSDTRGSDNSPQYSNNVYILNFSPERKLHPSVFLLTYR